MRVELDASFYSQPTEDLKAEVLAEATAAAEAAKR
eukprot:SAG31_NODE_17687_length_661_cov_1.092527_1_plen_34_part_10